MPLRLPLLNAALRPAALHRPAFLRSGLALMLAGALYGCASTLESQELRESPGYQAGYVDGCATAQEDDKSFSTRQQRDAYSFDNDHAYRAGWRQGYLECSNAIPKAKDGGRILGERSEY